MGLAPYPWLERPAEVLSKCSANFRAVSLFMVREDAACLNWLPALRQP